MDRGFNVRVYGLCINSKDEVLLEKGSYGGINYTKFPGGGLENGESTIDCLIREFNEELNWKIGEIEHFYTTDFYVASVFDEKEQVISIYYLVKEFDGGMLPSEFYWKKQNALNTEEVTFPIDKRVVELLQNKL